jgi:pyruvate,water dikinase
MVQYTLAFDECDSVGPQRLGGKCASLVALTAARVPVPPRFVLTSEAYAALLAVDGLNHRLECLLRRLGSTDLCSVEALSAELRSAILASQLR